MNEFHKLQEKISSSKQMSTGKGEISQVEGRSLEKLLTSQSQIYRIISK